MRGDVHKQNSENYWSLFKGGIYGALHPIGEEYRPCYPAEFDFRRNRRGVSDAEGFAALMGQVQGRLTWYCQTPQPENPHAQAWRRRPAPGRRPLPQRTGGIGKTAP